MTAVALTIAGSDPSGGAGIQADLRTFNALGVAGLSVITSLTVQNSRGVQGVHPVPADVLAAQLEAVLSDTRPGAVKIGMLGGAEQVRAVAAALRRHQPPNVVLDPVLASTEGVPLLDAEGRAALAHELLPLCDLVTPNLDEAEVLDLANASAVLLKGGHRPGEPTDVLRLAGGQTLAFAGERVETPHTHGTGCLLSSAIAGYLALGRGLQSAISEAKRRLEAALRAPVAVGAGRGCPNILHAPEDDLRAQHAWRLSRVAGVYVITDDKLRPDVTHQQIVRAAFAGGASVVQVRDKSTPLPALVKQAGRLEQIAQSEAGLLIVNDRVDVALASGADGVHLGPEDMDPEDARRLLGEGKLVGVSVNSVDEATMAAPSASYFGVGAIYGSKTKSDAGAPIGLESIRQIKVAFPNIPVVAIGGINAANIREVAAAGADAAAVVSAVVTAPDMAEATRELIRRFTAGKSSL